MKFYPYGELPVAEIPEWFKSELESLGLPPEEFPLYHIGEQEDWSVPAALFFEMPPNYRLMRHGHPTKRTEIIVRGTLELGDGRTASAGDIFTSDPGVLYGPHHAGPEGCTSIEIFGEIEGFFRMLYEDEHGQVQEADFRKGEVAPDWEPLPQFTLPDED